MGWSSFQALAWQAAPMPYSTGPVSIARLPSGNDDFLAFVRFPAGWSRSQPVVYEAAEEFVILEGELRIDDQCWVAPAYGCVAPGSVRRLTASQPGCLAWARFHGSPRAVKAEGAVQTADTARTGANRLRPAGALQASAPALRAPAPASWSESPRRLLHAFPASETWFEPAFRPSHEREAGRHDAIDLDTLAWWSSASDLPSRPPTPSDTPSRSAIVHRISEMQR
jgi:hypothetical protein